MPRQPNKQHVMQIGRVVHFVRIYMYCNPVQHDCLMFYIVNSNASTTENFRDKLLGCVSSLLDLGILDLSALHVQKV